MGNIMIQEGPDEVEIIETITTTISEKVIIGGQVVVDEELVEQTEIIEEVRKERTVILVAPNGDTHLFGYHDYELVGRLLKKGVEHFGKVGSLNPTIAYDLVKDSTILDVTQTLQGAAVSPGDRLSIRPKNVPVDGSC
jgi:hypothetical protein